MMHSANSRRFRLSAGSAVLLLTLSGCGAPDHSSGDNTGVEKAMASSAVAPPVPSAVASPTPSGITAAGQAKDVPADVALAMDESRPVGLRIPALDRRSEIIETGLRQDSTLEVPPGYEGAPASWYNGSPTPGELGPSVLLGHVNSTEDESGVFYNLEVLEKGDEVVVVREDGSTATFETYRSEIYPKDNFPTNTVYQPTDGAELRLITCDGFTDSTGEFANNLVIYAKLVAIT